MENHPAEKCRSGAFAGPLLSRPVGPPRNRGERFMLTRRHFLASSASAAALMLLATRARAEAGVAADKVTFGQAAPLEGPASALGRGMRDGIAAAFAEQNGRGGVHGRRLELVSKDDGYEPSQ